MPDAEVTFARGTGEPPGTRWPGVRRPPRQQTAAGSERPVNYAASRLQLHGEAPTTPYRPLSPYSSCPNTKLVLGGYSQGATVGSISWPGFRWAASLCSPLPAAYADNVAAVAVSAIRPTAPVDAVEPEPAIRPKAIDLCNPTDPDLPCGPRHEFSDTSTATYPPYTTLRG